ncbi:hypothetical protein IW245_006745 [Longispora fulva]|uniref:Uncharacterized protein n=1 Tax=Longispora fulva TaxID=619741 RepID=A0A8J7GYH2_9ACTN|nr:hypothetical protein [Longispora fulva]
MSGPTRELPIIDRHPTRRVYQASVSRRDRMVAVTEGACLPVVVVFGCLLLAYGIAAAFRLLP